MWGATLNRALPGWTGKPRRGLARVVQKCKRAPIPPQTPPSVTTFQCSSTVAEAEKSKTFYHTVLLGLQSHSADGSPFNRFVVHFGCIWSCPGAVPTDSAVVAECCNSTPSGWRKQANQRARVRRRCCCVDGDFDFRWSFLTATLWRCFRRKTECTR